MHLGESLPPELAFIAYLVLYTRRAMTLHSEGRPVPKWRIVSFVFGVTTMTAVQVGPLDTLSDDVLVAHMAQHIFIGDIASLFVVLGLTGPVLAPLLHFRLTRPVRVLASPAVALALWGLNLYGWHIPFMYQAAINHDLVHAVEHICFFWFGCLLWLALIGPLPKPAWFTGWAKLLYVIGVRFVGAVLGNVLIWASTVFYPVYKPTDAARGLNPLSDQNLAGGLMMVEEMILTTLILAWMFYLFAKQDEERQELMDLAAEHGIDLSDERAARAAASGQTDRLRERLLSGSSGPASGDG
ncbi:MAG TPA: cytochrome c oxidase assembly protein [Solirubrobacteraceae bacterium]|jgi:cytochrome c oxidase assembly factor CtaG|nr:cytochrome c oxidase assembly protein [Solirubrobacteraceae bacterium]